jgi:hypothetical protein
VVIGVGAQGIIAAESAADIFHWVMRAMIGWAKSGAKNEGGRSDNRPPPRC